MATIDEVYALAVDIQSKMNVLHGATGSAKQFIDLAVTFSSPDNPFRLSINADLFIAEQTPIYLAHLTAIETAADVLGTDALH